MALWTSSYPVEAGDRDPTFTWTDADGGASLDDSQNDIFSQFLDFEAGDTRIPGSANDADPFLMGHQHQLPQHAESSTSSGVSTADDYDFVSNSSNVAATMSAASYDVDPNSLNLFADGGAHDDHNDNTEADSAANQQHQISDSELERLEGISLHSPKKGSEASSPVRQPAAPATVNGRKSKKFVDALSSTIRKATQRKGGRKAPQLQRAVSPSIENPPMALKPPTNAHRVHTQHAPGHLPESPPLQCDTNVANFVSGYCDDPFSGGELSPTQPGPARYYSQGGLGTPLDSPTRASISEPASAIPNWHPQGLQQQQQQQQWGHHETWWVQDPHQAHINPENIDANMAMHSQHGELPYEYSQVADASGGGLMIHMPQPRQGQSSGGTVNDLTLNAQTYLPPPPPIPQSDRATRPPRAPSSGARHRNMSSSPMRKTRAPSASPSPNHKQSRQSSGGSVSSTRSASGRLPGSMPGTPCSVRKRRSRDTGGSMSAVSDDADGGAGLGLGGGIGFVNFTPHDGSVLMTGVAPSGSSKTKARREKEAQDRRRRLSEAAMKAVAAAGGDIEKLRQQGFDL